MIDHPYLNAIRKKKVHLVGLASAEVSAVAEFLHAQGVKDMVAHNIEDGVEFKQSFRRAHQSLSRAEQVKALERLEKMPVEKRFGDKYLEGIDEAEIIFPTQGWFLFAKNMPKLEELQANGVEFGSMMKLYLQLAHATIIGVTGTNGKGTTTHLICEMLKSGGKKVFLAGNDPGSTQMLDKLENMQVTDFLVLEISNRQLMVDLGQSPHIAVITNVTPNHLDEHRGVFAEYAEVKRSILKYQTSDDVAVLNFDNETTMEFAQKSEAPVYAFSTFKDITKGAMIERDDILFNDQEKRNKICPVSDVKLPSAYNLENILAAICVAKNCQVENEAICKAIRSWKGLPKRLEFICEAGGVKYYNDLMSTTPVSTERAIESFKQPVILISGGDAKGVDYFNLAECIAKKVKRLYLFPGTASDDLKKHFPKVHFSKFEECTDFDACLQRIKKDAQAEDVVLLSPGAAHFVSKFIEKQSPGFNRIIKDW
jgi:UDP-N-acetylmuramoylalanine--D-glutamate ligase